MIERFERVSRAATRAVAALAVFLILLAAAITVVDVFMRSIVGSPIFGTNDVVLLLLTVAVAGCFPYARAAFRLESVHPGTDIGQVVAETGFEFERPDPVPVTPSPSREDLILLRGKIAAELSVIYPDFMSRAYGSGSDA